MDFLQTFNVRKYAIQPACWMPPSSARKQGHKYWGHWCSLWRNNSHSFMKLAGQYWVTTQSCHRDTSRGCVWSHLGVHKDQGFYTLSRDIHSLQILWDFGRITTRVFWKRLRTALRQTWELRQILEIDLAAKADSAGSELGRYFPSCDAHLELHCSSAQGHSPSPVGSWHILLQSPAPHSGKLLHCDYSPKLWHFFPLPPAVTPGCGWNRIMTFMRASVHRSPRRTEALLSPGNCSSVLEDAGMRTWLWLYLTVHLRQTQGARGTQGHSKRCTSEWHKVTSHFIFPFTWPKSFPFVSLALVS